MSVNSVQVIGNVTYEPRLKEFANGGKLVTFGICWNNTYLNKKTDKWESIPNFFDIVVQREGLLDRVVNDVDVGNLVMINGQLRYRDWEDKESGKKRSSIHIFAFDVFKCNYLPKVENKQQGGSEDGSTSDDNIGF